MSTPAAASPGEALVSAFQVVRPDGSPAAGAQWVLEPTGYSGPMPVGTADANGMVRLTLPVLAALPTSPGLDGAMVPVVVMVLDGVPDRTTANVAHVGFVADLTRLPDVTLEPDPHGEVYVAEAVADALAPQDGNDCMPVADGSGGVVHICAEPHHDGPLNDVPVPIAENYGAGADWTTGIEMSSSKFTQTSWYVKFGGGDWDWGEGRLSTSQTTEVHSGAGAVTGVKWGVNYLVHEHQEHVRYVYKICGFFGLICHTNEQVRPYEFTGSITKENEQTYVSPYDEAGDPGPHNANCTRKYDHRVEFLKGHDDTLVGRIDLPGHGHQELAVNVQWTGEVTTGLEMVRWWDLQPPGQRQYANQFLFVPSGLDPEHPLSTNGKAVCPENAPQAVYTDASNKDLRNTDGYVGPPVVEAHCPKQLPPGAC